MAGKGSSNSDKGGSKSDTSEASDLPPGVKKPDLSDLPGTHFHIPKSKPADKTKKGL